MRSQTNRRAFTLSDLLGVMATGAVLGALAVAGAGRLRQEARTASSLSQLRWMAGVTGSYAADNADRFWTFSWQAGPLPHSDPTLPATAASDLVATAIQATEILRRLSGRPDLPLSAGWIPHVRYNHLPLVDYTGPKLPDFNFVNPADANRLRWARDPAAFDRGEFLPLQPAPGEHAKRWPYSSSYEAPPAMWDLSGWGHRVSQHGLAHSFYSVPSSTLGPTLTADVAFPSQKVVVHDTEQRIGRGLFALSAGARVVALRGDGSAGVDATRDANDGWIPNAPTAGPSLIAYTPSAWEAPTATGEPQEFVMGHYRWTRGGIAGRDFGAPEIDTGQP